MLGSVISARNIPVGVAEELITKRAGRRAESETCPDQTLDR